jgi:hypothetical protein
MDNVWIISKDAFLWQPVINQMKKQGIWNKVLLRFRPTLEECMQLRSSYCLPPDMEDDHELFYETLVQKRYELLDRLYRKTDWGTDRYNSASFHELSARIRIYYDFFKLVLHKEKISLVIFFNTPHMGWDNILYEVAAHYNITTLLLDQSKFSNKFFHSFDYEDYGTFATSRILGNLDTYPIEKKVEKDWFYMKKNRGQQSHITLKKLLNPSKYTNRLKYFIEEKDHLRLVRELCSRQRRPQAFFRFYTERYFKKKYLQVSVKTVSLEKKFVYFPLHMQPESVTSVWGGIYLDQILALERLSRLIPEDWVIYAKENPKQQGSNRDWLFFERLQQIPNLVYLSKNANTLELIKASQFVATIVGSAGWEAITGGKNVLRFGWGAWYKTLPGVYEYTSHLDINMLTNTPIDHALLEKKTADLLNKCGTGIIYSLHLPTVPHFSLEENTRSVVQSLKQILKS